MVSHYSECGVEAAACVPSAADVSFDWTSFPNIFDGGDHVANFLLLPRPRRTEFFRELGWTGAARSRSRVNPGGIANFQLQPVNNFPAASRRVLLTR
jgi:hypothetical protein